jgi:tripartite-type tricarboxylate transporter receptor subunit TctC
MDMVGARPLGGSPQDFAAFIRRENDKWAAVIRRAGIRPE